MPSSYHAGFTRGIPHGICATKPYTDTGAFSGSQVLVSVNFNYILRAMPALPRDHDTRHRMIALMIVAALRF